MRTIGNKLFVFAQGNMKGFFQSVFSFSGPMKRRISLQNILQRLAWVLLCGMAFGQGGTLGPKGTLGPNGTIGYGSASVASVAFDAAASGTAIPSGTTQTWNHTITGTNTALVVCIDTDTATTGVTYNGVAMTQFASHKDGASVAFAQGYVLPGAANGTHAIVVTYSASVGIANAKSMSFVNVNQTTPTRTAVSTDDGGSGSGTISGTVASATTGDAVVACDQVFGGSLTTMSPNKTAPTTTPSNPELKMLGGSFSMGMQYAVGVTGSTIMSWTLNASEFWSQVAVPLAHP
jgi:hypothetical protein